MSTTPTESHSPERDRDAEQTASPADRGANWMLVAMVACCAAIPLALVAVAVVGGSTFGSVSPFGWAILAAAFVAAMVVAHRIARSPRER
jgi:hypothetical protein